MQILLTQNMVYLPSLGGANKSNRLLLESLAARGHRCLAVVPATAVQVSRSRSELRRLWLEQGATIVSTSDSADVFQLAGVEIHCVYAAAELLSYLRNRIEIHKPDWTLLSSEDPGQALLEVALKIPNNRVLYLARTGITLPFGPDSISRSERGTSLLRRVEGIIVKSRYIQDYCRIWAGLDSRVLPISFYGTGPFANYGSQKNGHVVMINPCAIKGISIFRQLAAEYPNVPFAAVPTWGTTGRDLTSLRRLSNVTLLEPNHEIDIIFSRTRILLVPSLCAEGAARVIIEAMLRGIPVMASNVGGNAEAKLGVEFLLPVQPIQTYLNELDEKMIPLPRVPEQCLTPWSDALTLLLENQGKYEDISRRSRQAAIAHIAEGGPQAIEQYLLENIEKRRIALGPPTLDSVSTSPTNSGDGSEHTVHMNRSNIDENLPRERQSLLAALLLNRGGRNRVRTIPKQPRSDSLSLPLSFGQERLWFLTQLLPESHIYNASVAVRMRGRLELRVLKRSLQEIVRRHEILRTRFQSRDGKPSLEIGEQLEISLPEADLSGLNESDHEQMARGLAYRESVRPFDLSAGPLMRTSLLRLSDEDHILILSLHHIVSDGWSLGVFVREMSALYAAYQSGQDSPLPALPIQYLDYAVWQRERLRGSELERLLSYWRRKLDGASPLQLPSDRERPEEISSKGGRRTFIIDAESSQAVRIWSREHGVTPFMTLLASFQVLLHRYSGQTDIVIGTDIANRTHKEIEELIGFFVNQLILRTDLSGNPSFAELVERVRQTTLEAYTHQDLPFDLLVKALNPNRSATLLPLFKVLFTVQNTLIPKMELEGFQVDVLEIDRNVAKYDIGVFITESLDRFSVTWVYNSALFELPTIERWNTEFITIVQGAMARPHDDIDSLPCDRVNTL